MTKAQVREMVLERRPRISQEERRQAGLKISQRVIEMPVGLLTGAWRISIYLSGRDEIPTRYIARSAWEMGRLVCVPAWSRSERCYRLYNLEPKTPLMTGHYGIREPAVREPVPFWEVGGFVVPGLAFDMCGTRVGHGAGYYDKMLSQVGKSVLKVAVCYDWQVQQELLPQEPHDIAMDWIVTEKRAINCGATRSVMQKRSPS